MPIEITYVGRDQTCDLNLGTHAQLCGPTGGTPARQYLRGGSWYYIEVEDVSGYPLHEYVGPFRTEAAAVADARRWHHPRTEITYTDR